MRALIVDGVLSPGEKVPEKTLCDQFDVSRTPLREALKVLASEGLVTLTPNRGATVSELTLADLEDAFPVMGALEALAGEMACARITDDEIAAIRELHGRMVRHYEARAMTAYFKLNQEIHEAILAAAGNATLNSFYRSLAGRVRRARYIANISAERWARAVEEHDQILAALEARDGPALSRILKAHLANTFQTVKDGLTSDDAD